MTAYVPENEPSNAFLVKSGSSSTTAYLFLIGFGGLFALLGLASVGGGIKELVD